jgi:hypothetical protein
MLNGENLVAVRCRITRGGFSSERVFRVTLTDSTEYVGAAPAEYFFDEFEKPLPPDQPPRGVTKLGVVAGRVVGGEGQDGVLVSVPSGEVLKIDPRQIAGSPKDSTAHVSVQS